jgi:hypothetical protein
LFREKMSAAGFTLAGADHAIIPVMLGDAVVAQNFARELQKEGIYVTGFFFPVAKLSDSPLAGGLLSGKYGRDGSAEAGGRRLEFDFPPVEKERAFDCAGPAVQTDLDTAAG